MSAYDKPKKNSQVEEMIELLKSNKYWLRRLTHGMEKLLQANGLGKVQQVPKDSRPDHIASQNWIKDFDKPQTEEEFAKAKEKSKTWRQDIAKEINR